MQEFYTNEQVERWCQMAQDDGKLWGAMEERERIIKLLEDDELHSHSNNLMANYDQVVYLGIKEQLIALIRGEQK